MRLLIVLAILLLQDTKPEDLPSIRVIHGDIRVWRKNLDQVDSVKKESRVGYGDRIGTPSGESACLQLLAGEEIVGIKGVKVAREKGLALERAGATLLLKIYDGRLTLESFRTEVAVETPNGTVRGKQSYFYIEVTEDKTKVVAIDGPLTFATSLGTVELKGGEESTSTKGGKPTDPKPADPKSAREFGDAPVNLIQNPGFEQDLKHWDFRYGDPDRKYASVDRETVHGGARSLRADITAPRFSTRDGGLVEQRVNVTAGRRYLYRAYLRRTATKGTVNIGISVGPVADGELRDSAWLFPTLRDDGWTMARMIVTAKAATLDVAVTFQIRSDEFEARAWVDDAFLMELPDSPRR